MAVVGFGAGGAARRRVELDVDDACVELIIQPCSSLDLTVNRYQM